MAFGFTVVQVILLIACSIAIPDDGPLHVTNAFILIGVLVMGFFAYRIARDHSAELSQRSRDYLNLEEKFRHEVENWNYRENSYQVRLNVLESQHAEVGSIDPSILCPECESQARLPNDYLCESCRYPGGTL